MEEAAEEASEEAIEVASEAAIEAVSEAVEEAVVASEVVPPTPTRVSLYPLETLQSNCEELDWSVVPFNTNNKLYIYA